MKPSKPKQEIKKNWYNPKTHKVVIIPKHNPKQEKVVKERSLSYKN